MAHRLRIVGTVAVALFASVALAQAQSANYTTLGPSGGYHSSNSLSLVASGYSAANGGSSIAIADAAAAAFPAAQDGGQEQGNGEQGQGMNMNRGMTGNQNQNQNQNQKQNGQGKEQTPPPKPTYLTYTVKKKSLQEQAKTGKALSVDFKSVPAGAVVTVDGYFLGHTPMTTKIPLGKHLVSVTKWGYESWEKEVDVSKGQSLNVNAKLHKDW